MVRKWAVRVGATLAVAAVTFGCAPDTGMVCDRVEQLFATTIAKPYRDHAACVSTMERHKKLYGVNSYRRLAACFLENESSFEAKRCVKKEEERVK